MHEVHFNYAWGANPVVFTRSNFWNDTAIPWTGFEILLEGADFAGWSFDHATQARTDSSLVDIGILGGNIFDLAFDQIGLQHPPMTQFTLANSSIQRVDNGGGEFHSKLTIGFSGPIALGNAFTLWYNIIPPPGASGATGFTAFLTPIHIPEPTLLPALAFIMLCALARSRRAA